MRNWLKKGKKVTAAAARGITGINSPLGGLQWADPGPSDQEIVRGFLVFLEDRRVLYNPYQLEISSQVEHSIHAIREECTKTLRTFSPRVFATTPIRSIRAACRRFHDDQNEEFRFFDRHWEPSQGRPGFFAALGAFRATVGQQVAMLAAHYDLDVEGDLATVIPSTDEE